MNFCEFEFIYCVTFAKAGPSGVFAREENADYCIKYTLEKLVQ